MSILKMTALRKSNGYGKRSIEIYPVYWVVVYFIPNKF